MQHSDNETRTALDALNDLVVAIFDNLTIAVPVLLAAAVPLVMAWFKKRNRQLEDYVKDEAIQAEKDHGEKHGTQKHAQVSGRARQKFKTVSLGKIDELIQTRGKDAGNAYRRESMVPPEAT